MDKQLTLFKAESGPEKYTSKVAAPIYEPKNPQRHTAKRSLPL